MDRPKFRPFLVLLFATFVSAACGDRDKTPASASNVPSNPATDEFASSLGITLSEYTRLSDDVYISDLEVGSGREVANGNVVRAFYTGYLVNGEQFESNVGGDPISFRVGTGEVIRGWDEGLLGMKEGGKRRIVIGSNAGYGATGGGPIPPHSTIIFDVELVSIE